MKNKIFILLMSCNQPLYEREEQACRDTFLKIAEGVGIPYWFYKGGDVQRIDTETHTLHLNAPDNLAGTSLKTLLAFSAALSFDWDYLVKTNVSTYLDIGKIQEAADLWEGRDDHNIYGARWLVNDASKRVPFPRGHFTILPRSLVEGVVKWTPRIIGLDGYPKTDDTLLCLATLYHLQKELGENYTKHMMEVPSVVAWSDDIASEPEWTDALSIRCKDGEDTPENMRKVHSLRMTGTTPGYRRPATLFETPYGMLSYETYAKVKSLSDKMKEEKQP